VLLALIHRMSLQYGLEHLGLGSGHRLHVVVAANIIIEILYFAIWHKYRRTDGSLRLAALSPG
jgi:hypothetical protein